MLISIIIPVYNGEKHIEKCLGDILRQTYKKFEIIVINDGSTDKTLNILKRIAKEDERVKVIDKKNTGVSDTRNLGIKESTGDCIMFVDSDDSLLDNSLEKIVNVYNDKKSDLVLFGFKVIGDKKRPNDTQVLNELSKNNLVNKNEILKHLISTNNSIYGYIWRAIYSKKLLINNNIIFPNGIKISEDYLFLAHAIFKAKSIAIDNNEYYLYCINDSSMTTKYIPSLIKDMNYVNDWLYKNIVSIYPELQHGYDCCVCNTYLRYVQNTIRNNNSTFREQVKIITKSKKNFKRYIKNSKLFNDFNKKDSISILFFKLNLEIVYMILFKFLQKIKKYTYS